MYIPNHTGLLGRLLIVLMSMMPMVALAENPDLVVEEAGEAPVMATSKCQGQWFKDVSEQSEVKYIFIGRPSSSQAYLVSSIPFAANSKMELIEIVSSENSSKGRGIIQRLADRLSNTLPLELVFQTRDEDDGSLLSIFVITGSDNPDVGTDILIYKWSKTFEVALIHLKGEFDLNNVVWGMP